MIGLIQKKILVTNNLIMKTNQEMIRKMGEFEVTQRTKDSFFNATGLLKKWNEKNPKEQRRIDKFWDSTNLDKLMAEIAKNELSFTSPNFGDLKNVLSITSKARFDNGGGTWMHPILFIKFAMYLSPRFEYHVLKFVSDEMIKYRNEVGDSFKDLASEIQKIVDSSSMPNAMKKISEALNWIVFNSHEKMLRNKNGEEQSQKELYMLEKKLSDLINDGFITNFHDLILYMRRLYERKYRPDVFK